MAVLSSQNNIDVTVNTKANTKGVDDTAKSLDQLDSQSEKSSSGFGKLGGAAAVAKTAIVALGVATGAAAVASIKSAADFEQTRIALENMLRSSDVAKQVL